MTSDKTSPLHDDEMKAETQGQFKANRDTRAEEERELQPSGEDQPEASRAPDAHLHGGAPPGMTGEEVELRSDLARHLGAGLYPADRAKVLDTLRGNHAPDRLVGLAERLPEGEEFGNMQDVARALGMGVEEHRT